MREYTRAVNQMQHTAAFRGVSWWLRVLVLPAIALLAFVAGIAATWGYVALRRVPEVALRTTTSELRNTTAVVTALRDLAVLETATYHVERVIDLRDKQSQLFGLFESEDSVLLVAAADVVAGVDLGSLREGDVSVDQERRRATIVLPQPSVIWARLDNDSTYVHSRNTDVLALRARTLETRARQAAEQTMRDAALSAGILGRARQNAARTIQTLVQALGFAEVQVVFESELPSPEQPSTVQLR